jgi:hypothetical protein
VLRVLCVVLAVSRSVNEPMCRMQYFVAGNADQNLPYELHAFEVPLAAAVRSFELEAAALEKVLLPSLQRLSARVRTSLAKVSMSLPFLYIQPACMMHVLNAFSIVVCEGMFILMHV